MSTIRFERDGSIGSVVLANPPFNRLDSRFAAALREAVHQASANDIRVLIVKSEGPHFSFGGEVREWPGKDVNWFRKFVADVDKILSGHRSPPPSDGSGRTGFRARRWVRVGACLRFSYYHARCELPLR